MSSEKFEFPPQLLDLIRSYRNDEVRSLLNENLILASDAWGTLLHHAAQCGATTISHHLIQMGSNANYAQNVAGNIPLMLAVTYYHVKTIRVLLKGGADIGIANDNDDSALQMVFHSSYSQCNVIELFIDKMRAKLTTTEQLVEKLFSLGSSMYHVACTRDVQVMRSMLERGFNVNSRGPNQATALHAAVMLNDFTLTKWLVDNDADVNTCDFFDYDALHRAAANGNKVILQFLMDHGANPNVRNDTWSAALFATFSCLKDGVTEVQYVECAECLLQNGAIPHNTTLHPYTMFDLTLKDKRDKRIRLLVSHLAMLELLGNNSITKAVMYCKKRKYPRRIRDYEKFYLTCLQVLKTVMFDKLTLVDLLSTRESKMKILVRNENFLCKIKDVCSKHELSELYPYYYNTLMRCVSEANEAVELQEAAISVIIRLSKGNFTHYYIAREIVGYLSKKELRELIRVCE